MKNTLIKFFIALIGIYNFIILKFWGFNLSYLTKPVENTLPVIWTILGVALACFFLIQSIRLLLLNEGARKIQIKLCGMDVIFRFLFLLIVLFINLNQFGSRSLRNLSLSLFITGSVFILDVLIILFLENNNSKKQFEIAEQKRDEKFREKLLKSNPF